MISVQRCPKLVADAGEQPGLQLIQFLRLHVGARQLRIGLLKPPARGFKFLARRSHPQLFLFRCSRRPPCRAKDQANHRQRKQRDLRALLIPARHDAESCQHSDHRRHKDSGEENAPGHGARLRTVREERHHPGTGLRTEERDDRQNEPGRGVHRHASRGLMERKSIEDLRAENVGGPRDNRVDRRRNRADLRQQTRPESQVEPDDRGAKQGEIQRGLWR